MFFFLFSVDQIPCLNPTEWLMSPAVAVIGSQLQPTLPMLSDWPPETYIVLCVAVAHVCSDLIYSGTYVNIFFFVLPCIFLLCACFYHFILCFLFLSVASITCLSVYFAGVPSFSAWLLTACGALISHVEKIRVQGVCVSLCIYMYKHTFITHFSILANPTTLSLSDFHIHPKDIPDNIWVIHIDHKTQTSSFQISI